MAAVRQTIVRILLVIVFALTIGIAASLIAIFFVESVHYLNWLFLLSADSRAGVDRNLLMLATVAVPVAGGVVVGQVRRWVADGRLHGPPEIIQAAQVGNGEIRWRDGLWSGLANLVALATGASTGQYGPLAHLGAAIGSALARFARRFSQEVRLSGPIGVACGVAAAIATAFNAPIAGVVFAHEVVLRHYSLRAFAPVTVAATVGYVISSSVLERPPLFSVEVGAGAHPLDYVGFVAIGVIGALVSLCFMRAVLGVSGLARQLAVPGSAKPAIAGFTLGLIALVVPQVMGIGVEAMQLAMGKDGANFALSALGIILIAKLLATAICVGFGFGGGVFAPALFIGTFFGAFVGAVATYFLGAGAAEPTFYAICGMAAVVSPVIGAPLTTILIVFELTRNYELTTAVMVSIVFANLVTGRFFGRSLYDVQLLRRGFDLSYGREKILLQRNYVADHLEPKWCTLAPELSIAEARDILLRDGGSEGYMVDADGNYLGVLQVAQVLALSVEPGRLAESAAEHTILQEPIFYADTSIWDALQGMEGFVGETIPVCDKPESNRLIGVISEAAIVHAYLGISRGLRQEEHAAD